MPSLQLLATCSLLLAGTSDNDNNDNDDDDDGDDDDNDDNDDDADGGDDDGGDIFCSRLLENLSPVQSLE